VIDVHVDLKSLKLPGLGVKLGDIDLRVNSYGHLFYMIALTRVLYKNDALIM